MSFNFTAAVTICNDFGPQKNKVWHCFHCFPIYFPWSDGTGCYDLRFLNVEFWANFSTLLFLLNISCIFSILPLIYLSVTPVCFKDFESSLLITLNSFSGRFPISSCLVLFGVFLPWSFTCWIFLCLFICSDRCVCCGHQVGWKFVVPLTCVVYSL